MFHNAFIQAVREIRRNLMRSLLTAVGIVIGIASVIIMVNIGKGASQTITQSVEKLGSNTLYIIPGQNRGANTGSVAKPFSKKDLETLRGSVYTLKAISPVQNVSMTVVYKEQNYRTMISGVENDYLQIQNWKVVKGRDFEAREIRTGKNVCIVGQTVIKSIFTTPNALIVGEKIRLKNFSCEIIGTLDSKGANTFGMDQDDIVLVPFALFQRRISGTDTIPLMMAVVKPNIPLAEAKVQIERVLRQDRHIESIDEDDFSVRSMTALLDTVLQVTTALTLMLGAVAAISLVVGGIGIMNIMLVSVTERTREIGIRMAVGAMANDILVQFLIEAIVLSGFGGVVGIAFGVLMSVAISQGFDIVLVIDPSIVVVSLLFSTLIGIVFGIIPARKAACMNPIDALRFE